MPRGISKILFLISIAIVVIIAIILVKKAEAPTESIRKDASLANQSKNMKLVSSVFENNGNIPAKYTCDGENINPPLEISGVPEGAKSLVLIVDDPDAPAGDWVHWTIWNITLDIKAISENSVPDGSVEGTTSFGKPGYGGPCPPSGTHHYQFKLYALDTLLTLESSAKKKDIERAMEGHILDKTILVGLYQRN